jgi:hypothetical protein
LIGVSLAIAAIAHGWGKPAAFFTPENLLETRRLQFAVQTVWIVTYCLVRLSVACSLLRYGFDRSWRWSLYIIMASQVTISSSYVVIQFAQCTPISFNWAMVPDAKCWDIAPIITYGWIIAGMYAARDLVLFLIFTGVYIAMDLALSLMPIRLIRTLNRSTSEKVLICILMAMGLLATAVACAKMTTFTTFGKGDPMQGTIMPSLLAKVEEQVGIIATSLSCLKNPVEKLLKSLGVLKDHQLARPSFVADLSMPGLPMAQDEPDSDASSTAKKEIRVDSMAVRLGNSPSNASSEGRQSKTWQAV